MSDIRWWIPRALLMVAVLVLSVVGSEYCDAPASPPAQVRDAAVDLTPECPEFHLVPSKSSGTGMAWRPVVLPMKVAESCECWKLRTDRPGWNCGRDPKAYKYLDLVPSSTDRGECYNLRATTHGWDCGPGWCCDDQPPLAEGCPHLTRAPDGDWEPVPGSDEEMCRCFNIRAKLNGTERCGDDHHLDPSVPPGDGDLPPGEWCSLYVASPAVGSDDWERCVDEVMRERRQ